VKSKPKDKLTAVFVVTQKIWSVKIMQRATPSPVVVMATPPADSGSNSFTAARASSVRSPWKKPQVFIKFLFSQKTTARPQITTLFSYDDS
jgi:hypothetical protein